MASEETELITLKVHNIPVSLLLEFAKKIIGPYFDGNFNEAIRQLMDQAVIDEELLQSRLDKRRVLR